MSFIDQISDALGGAAAKSGTNDQLMQMALAFLQQHGGIQGLLSQFQQQGLGDLVLSWIGSGKNSAISTEQLAQVFGSKQIGQMAASSGLSENELLTRLSGMLPQIVDRLTPDGQSGTGDDLLKQGMSVLSSLF